MNKWIKVMVVGFVLVGGGANAHDGHAIPGVLPPAPHGGVLKEAEHAGKDYHAGHGSEEVELFFEVVYKDKHIVVYPLTLDPKNTKVFLALSPSKDLAKIGLKAELPRQKKTEVLNPQVGGEVIRVPFDAKGATRFIVHLSTEFQKEIKVAKVQVEVP